MNFTESQKTLLVELIKDKFHLNKENIQYCKNYMNDQFLMEETKEEKQRNIEANKKLIIEVRKQQVELYDLFKIISNKSIRHIYN
jgi:DNA polymerase III delta prime subunit